MLESAPEDALVVIPACDHSYREARCQLATGLIDDDTGQWTEDHGEEVTPEAEYGTRLPILLVRV